MCDSIEIQQYLEQLSQVEQAIELCENDEEKTSLESLKNDLNELLQLTIQTQQQQEQLQEESNGSCDKTDTARSDTKNGMKKSNPAAVIDDEMALFMSEIKKIETTSNDVKDCVEEKEAELKLEDIKEELLAMVGQKCSAPHQHSWGSTAYHNALICGIDNTKEYELDDVQNFCVRVLFTNPTHQEMLPCSYYLEGECRFDVDKCRYSHGELIPFRELKEYHEPDFTKLEKHCIVLAKMNDKLWHKARVLTANFETKTCLVRIDRGKKDIDCKFEDLLPMFYDEDLTSDSSTDANDSECESDADSNLTSDHYLDAAKQAKLIERSLLSPNANQKLGEWEKHTKGFGSKILQKLGYVVGTGLGTNGEGIVIPISAQVLPPGRSLDHCMELREMANGDENLFSVERKMKKEQKRAEAQSAKQYEKESNRSDMFSFLNQNILTGVGGSNGDTNDQNNRSNPMNNQQKPKASDYKNHSVKNLNVESVRLADDIRRKEKEIDQLKESMKRHTSGTDIHKKMQKMMSVKDQELDNLKKSEHYLSKEQNSRKNKSKLDIF